MDTHSLLKMFIGLVTAITAALSAYHPNPGAADDSLASPPYASVDELPTPAAPSAPPVTTVPTADATTAPEPSFTAQPTTAPAPEPTTAPTSSAPPPAETPTPAVPDAEAPTPATPDAETPDAAARAAPAPATPGTPTTPTGPVSYGSSGQGNPDTSGCTVPVADGTIQAAVDAAPAGSVVCVSASARESEALSLNKAVTVRATGAVTIASAELSGSDAALDGFTVAGPAENGISYTGTNHTIATNLVSGRGINTGIRCSDCGSGHLVTGNTVTAVTNYGIWVSDGEGIIVERNNVYDLWKDGDGGGDVDAMRFWGTNLTIRNNYFHDINEHKSSGSPHTDCMQTYQTGDRQIARNILIENNYCVRVSRQALIASNHLECEYDISDFVVRGNVFETYDASVVNLGSVSNITLENNFFLGGVKAQVLAVDYTREESPCGLPDENIKLRNNIVMKASGSAEYFYQGSTKTLTDNTANLLVENPVVSQRADVFHGETSTDYPAQQEADFTSYRDLAAEQQIVDQGSEQLTTGHTTDLAGAPRTQGAAIDMGPFEAGGGMPPSPDSPPAGGVPPPATGPDRPTATVSPTATPTPAVPV